MLLRVQQVGEEEEEEVGHSEFEEFEFEEELVEL